MRQRKRYFFAGVGFRAVLEQRGVWPLKRWDGPKIMRRILLAITSLTTSLSSCADPERRFGEALAADSGSNAAEEDAASRVEAGDGAPAASTSNDAGRRDAGHGATPDTPTDTRVLDGGPSDSQSTSSSDAEVLTDAPTCTGESCGECTPTETRCQNDREEQTCSSEGVWGPSKSCEYVCVESAGRCGGECIPDTRTCVTQRARYCDAGTWIDTPCEAPDEICRAGVCQANEPYSVGHHQTLEGFCAPLDGLATAVDISEDVELLALGSATNGAQGTLAIYADTSDYPGKLIATTPDGWMDLEGGVTHAPSTSGVILAAGRYWIAGRYDSYFENKVVGCDEAATGNTTILWWGPFENWPETFPSKDSGLVTINENEAALNHFIRVRAAR